MSRVTATRKPQVLAIDDDAELLELLKLRIDSHGYEARVETSAQRGISLVGRTPIDAMILEPAGAFERREHFSRLLLARGTHERDREAAWIEELLDAGPMRRELILSERVEEREEERRGLGPAFRVEALAEPEKRARRGAGGSQDAAGEIRRPIS